MKKVIFADVHHKKCIAKAIGYLALLYLQLFNYMRFKKLLKNVKICYNINIV